MEGSIIYSQGCFIAIIASAVLIYPFVPESFFNERVYHELWKRQRDVALVVFIHVIVNSAYPDQTLNSEASDMGLHYLPVSISMSV